MAVGEERKRRPGPELTTGRLQGLADGIFGFAMTLLVLNLALPQGLSEAELASTLSRQGITFYSYGLSFILLGFFWISHHHHFHHIKKTDGVHIWINIILLMFVALVPFSTALMSDYFSTNLAQVFFSANMMAIGLLFAAHWAYAVFRHRLVEADIDKEIITSHLRRSFVVPIVTAIVMVVALYYPRESNYIYLVIIVLFLTPPFKHK